jgi:hypothetical protein
MRRAMKLEMNIRSAMLKGGELTLPISTLKNIFSPYFAQEQFSAPVGSAYAVILPEVVGKSLTPPVSPHYEAIPPAPPPAPPEWWDPNWTKRRAITINGYHPADYQLRIVLPFYDPSIRFLENATSGLLPYWVESYTANSMTVWVKRSIANDGDDHTIYVYYNNPNAGSASSGINTFVFFDDASSDRSSEYTRETSLGGTSGTWTWNSAGYYASGGLSTGQEQHVSFGTSLNYFAVQAKMSMSSTAGDKNVQVGCGRFTSTEWVTGRIGLYTGVGTYHSILKRTSAGETDLGANTNLGLLGNTWYLMKTYFWSGPNVKTELYNEAGTTLISSVSSTSITDLSGKPFFYNYQSSGTDTRYFKDIIVRKFVSPEPTTSVGDEEQYGG